jgi:transposase-like protein
MINFKGMRFPIGVILVCIRWYAAYPLSYRHLEEIMEEHDVSVDQSVGHSFPAAHREDGQETVLSRCGSNDRFFLERHGVVV